ncbi:alpha-2-macroglobulin-like protein 1 isoform X2 [Portunus trituberculatus]|uniref:alpha-2-macroglobulin-like protein 1 isoform X2 n=1 Tax=Portunus trituberculatus TaxID=210409 RepID=UPI001E1CE64F|nr:alpha-2-macroglobulin-like protein 1 isoform X2 [Portunus trituberculatus]
MARWCPARRLLGLTVFVAVVAWCSGNYIITTPRKWAEASAAQVCLFNVGGGVEEVEAPVEGVEVKVEGEHRSADVLVPPQFVSIPPGQTEVCRSIPVPAVDHMRGKLHINGTLGGKSVTHTETIKFAAASQTFVQTDKFLYAPGQKVQFRILTVYGPYLRVFTGMYPEMWIESPSGSRIAQWVRVESPGGLIHQEFQLINEPEEGTYKIHVESPVGGSKAVQTFKIEDFVLPRFEVTLQSPPYILATTKSLHYRVCAMYTYGQPVKGEVTFDIRKPDHYKVTRPITGCENFTIAMSTSLSTSYGHSTVNVVAKVVEEGTGEEAQATGQIDVQRKVLKFKHVGKEEYVKPNLPYTGQFKVTLPSDEPAANELMTICKGDTCRNITTDARGLVEYIYPKHEDFSIEISSPRYPRIENPERSWSPIMYKSADSHRVKTYYSPSNSSLVIKTPEVQLRCHAGETQNFTVSVMYAGTRDSKANFTIQLVSRGQIQFTHTEEHTLTDTDLPIDSSLLLVPLPPATEGVARGVLSLPLTIHLTASPSAKVLVWYTRPDGEVVSAMQEIRIKKCLTNLVSLAWSTNKAEPGEEVHLDLNAEPNSLCSLGVVDKSVELLQSNEDHLTLEGVFKVVKKAIVGDTENSQINDNEYCQKKREEDEADTTDPLRPGMPIPFAEEEPAGVVKRSIWHPYGHYTEGVDAIKMFEKSGLFVFTDLKVENRPCHFREMILYYGLPGAVRGMGARRGPPILPPASIVREVAFNRRNHIASVASEPERTRAEPSSPTRSYFPETWLWKLLPLPAAGNSSQALTLPHTITEWIGKAVCVHPEKGVGLSSKESITTFTPFFVDLTLPPSVQRGEILPVKISVFNYLEGALPVKVVLSESPEYEILEDPLATTVKGSASSCIPSKEKVVFTVKIRPNALGDVNLNVEAFVDELFPEDCGSEYVISKRDHIIKPIRVELEGFPQEKTWTKYMCTDGVDNEEQLVSWHLEAPSNIVPDSTRGWITAVGDLLGPTLDNLGSLVRMPYGCGEQNMVNFAPNIFVMQYLEAAEKTTADIATKAIEFMKSGYQRELRYRHKDGSFSAFGPSDESGSTWLTAFVLKSFAQAQQFIPIDTGDIDMSREWLKRDQMENGCFLSKGKVFHKSMKGGIAGNESPVPLTAYILTALLEAGELIVSRPISEAAFCLVSDKSEDPYTLALKAYALALAEAPEAAQFVVQLRGKATVSTEGMYWEMPPVNGKSAAAGVETAAYALLAMATLSPVDYLNDMQKLVKWISSKRNGQGGFVSTQDTVVALQALAKFEMVLGQKPVDVAVLASSASLDHSFRITETNRLLLQRVDLPSFPTTVTADLAGEGCALVQAVLRYNIPEEDPSTAFNLTATTQTVRDDKCITKRIRACASYTLPDLKSNMAVIEINLVSGYIPDKNDLKQVVGYGTGLIKRYEVDGRKVTFYIDEFSPEDLCVAFKVTREVDVENPKPGTVRVYDYYDPDQFVSTSYTFPPNEECASGSDLDGVDILVIPSDDIAVDYIDYLV